MEVGDYVIACPGMHAKAIRKISVRNPQKPDTTQHTSRQKLAFKKSYDPSNVAIAK